MSDHEYAICPDCGMKDVTIQSAPGKPDRMLCYNCRWNSLDGSSDDTDDIGDLATDGGTERESAGDKQEGLYGKYTVLKDGKPQDGTFVLKPESDPAALAALKTYAKSTDDEQLSWELKNWIDAIERSGGEDSE